MGSYFTHDLICHLVVFQAVLLLIVLGNIFLIRRTRRHSPPDVLSFVSVLVPARNEERSISRCIQSLLAQDYPSFEVLVLDDSSTDGTRAILIEIAASQPRLVILEGQPPASGLVGKSWACTQLAGRAKGDLLYFTDAETWHRPDALRLLVTALLGERADLLTGFPRQEMRTYVCGQCHVEYYFKGPEKRLVFPWARGLSVDRMLEYYDEVGHKDWVHAETGAEVLKAQHPEFENWNQGIHAR